MPLDTIATECCTASIHSLHCCVSDGETLRRWLHSEWAPTALLPLAARHFAQELDPLQGLLLLFSTLTYHHRVHFTYLVRDFTLILRLSLIPWAFLKAHKMSELAWSCRWHVMPRRRVCRKVGGHWTVGFLFPLTGTSANSQHSRTVRSVSSWLQVT